MIKTLENLPFWLFWLVIFSLPFANFPDLREIAFPIQLTGILFLFAGIAFGICVLFRRVRIRVSLFYLPLTLYFGSLCLSTYFSEDQKTSLIKLTGESYLIGLGILAFNLVDDENKFRKIGMAWLSATFLVCFVSFASLVIFYVQRDNPILLSTLSHFGSLPTGNYARIQSTFYNPNMLCNYLNVSVVFLLLAFKFKWLKREVLLIFSTVFPIAVFFTVSPGIGGIFLSVGLWYWVDWKSTKPLFAKLSLAIGILGAVFFFLTVLPSPTNFPTKIEPSARILTWVSAVETLQKHPVVGRGIGLDAAFVEYTSSNGIQKLGDAHQLWLNVAAQQGIIGLAAIVFLTGWFVCQSFQLSLSNSTVSTFKAAFAFAFLGAFCLQGLSGSYEDARHLWVLIGLLGSVNQLKSVS